jgi:hypothetical protein
MSKRSGRKGISPAPRRLPWLWIAAGAAVVLIAGGVVMLSAQVSPAAPAVAGAPRLAVDRTTVDEGYVKFGTPVHETFRLSNAGNQPLQILGQPQVELVQGC